MADGDLGARQLRRPVRRSPLATATDATCVGVARAFVPHHIPLAAIANCSDALTLPR